jgi:hypothetical protein
MASVDQPRATHPLNLGSTSFYSVNDTQRYEFTAAGGVTAEIAIESIDGKDDTLLVTFSGPLVDPLVCYLPREAATRLGAALVSAAQKTA